MLEAQAREHEVYYCGVLDLSSHGSIPYSRFRRAEVARRHPHYELYEERAEPLSWFDAIFMRKDPPVDLVYLYATHLLSLVDSRQTVVLNNPAALRDANEKLYALNFPDVIPPTLVTCDRDQLKQFMKSQGDEMIVKPLDGCGGAGIFHVHQGDRNLNAILEAVTDNGRRLIMAQRYLPEVRRGDKRVIVLNGDALGCILRVPREDEHRGNIHVGGRVEKGSLTSNDRHIVATLAPRLKRDGLYFVGLDIIGDFLTEVNVTSPTGVQEIDALEGVNLSRQVIRFVERKVPKSAGS
jgi:glutathione synthase